MVTTFLENLAIKLMSTYGDDISRLCIVLPNRRAGLFLKKYISTKISKPIWSPTIFSSEDFISEISGLQVIDQMSLLFELYQVHVEIEKEKAESFDEFMQWGSVLLHDFNDVDLYMVDAESLYGYLSETKALALWNPDGKALTEFQKIYLRLYGSFNNYFVRLKERLLAKNKANQGLAYRKTAEEIKMISDFPDWSKIIFAGFNALNTAEEVIITHLLQCGKAEFIPDTDDYYLNNPLQEAGKFLRSYRKKWAADCFKTIEKNYAAPNTKEINFIGVSKSIAQVKLAGEILQKNILKTDLENTAVVLADENLLIPLLNSIPEDIKEFNITMGYQLRNVPLYRLFDAIFSMHENAGKLNNHKSNNQPAFYFKDVLNIFHQPTYHSLLSKSFSDNRGVADSISEKLIASNKVFYSIEDIKSVLSSVKLESSEKFIIPFESWNEKPENAIECFLSFIEMLRDHFIDFKDDRNIDLEYLYHFSIAIKKIRNLFEENNDVIQIKTLRMLFRQEVGSMTIPFYGEPLKGLQIMGMLETRVLDFKNIILLSANEGVIPAAKFQHSFIPVDIKSEFNLPTYRDHEAVFAYHFYRLLQRAENITIMYNTDVDTFGNGERSRFISQMLYELPLYNPSIKLQESVLSVSPTFETEKTEIIIPKTSEIIECIKERAKSGFSPSTLNKYIKCPLQFYFSAIAGIEEPDEVEETIDASTLGTVVHHVLESFYKPFVGKYIYAEDIKKMLPEVEKKTKKAFISEYKNGDVDFGKNLLIVKVANKFIQNFLYQEIRFLEELKKKNQSLKIVELEKQFETSLILENNQEIKLKGKIDRVDSIGNTFRIIDYKTGGSNLNKLSIKEWGDIIENSNFDKCFQLMMYAWLFYKNKTEKEISIQSGIIAFRKLTDGFKKVSVPECKENLNIEAFSQFEDVLKKLLLEIINPELAFYQTKETDNCKYCPFINICLR
jgi:ATP-dependent helicase/nuclease subunit B